MKKLSKILSVMLLMVMVLVSAVPAQAATMSLSKKSVELVPNETVTLKVKNAGKKKVVWKSSNKKVATVTSKGKVTAKNQSGKSCTISATVAKKTYKCKVKVVKSKVYDTFMVWATNVTISGLAKDGETYVEGARVEFVDVIQKKDGYYFTISEAHNYDISDFYVENDNDGKGFYIGKKLPKCFTNPTIYEEYNYKQKTVNLFLDGNDKFVFEEGISYNDETWKIRMEELGN